MKVSCVYISCWIHKLVILNDEGFVISMMYHMRCVEVKKSTNWIWKKTTNWLSLIKTDSRKFTSTSSSSGQFPHFHHTMDACGDAVNKITENGELRYSKQVTNYGHVHIPLSHLSWNRHCHVRRLHWLCLHKFDKLYSYSFDLL